MKARVKATGEIISLDEKSTVLDINPCNFNSYEISELEILYENTNFPPDYWTRLEHQYAGMVMQGMLANANHYLWERKQNYESLVANAAELAHALVEKYKKEE